MRTTITLADDVYAEVERLRRERGLGPSDAVNELARAGMIQRQVGTPFKQKTYPLGIKIDISDVAQALEAVEGPTWK